MSIRVYLHVTGRENVISYRLPEDNIIDDVCEKLELTTRVGAVDITVRDPDSHGPIHGEASLRSVVDRGWGLTGFANSQQIFLYSTDVDLRGSQSIDYPSWTSNMLEDDDLAASILRDIHPLQSQFVFHYLQPPPVDQESKAQEARYARAIQLLQHNTKATQRALHDNRGPVGYTADGRKLVDWILPGLNNLRDPIDLREVRRIQYHTIISWHLTEVCFAIGYVMFLDAHWDVILYDDPRKQQRIADLRRPYLKAWLDCLKWVQIFTMRYGLNIQEDVRKVPASFFNYPVEFIGHLKLSREEHSERLTSLLSPEAISIVGKRSSSEYFGEELRSTESLQGMNTVRNRLKEDYGKTRWLFLSLQSDLYYMDIFESEEQIRLIKNVVFPRRTRAELRSDLAKTEDTRGPVQSVQQTLQQLDRFPVDGQVLSQLSFATVRQNDQVLGMTMKDSVGTISSNPANVLQSSAKDMGDSKSSQSNWCTTS